MSCPCWNPGLISCSRTQTHVRILGSACFCITYTTGDLVQTWILLLAAHPSLPVAASSATRWAGIKNDAHGSNMAVINGACGSNTAVTNDASGSNTAVTMDAPGSIGTVSMKVVTESEQPEARFITYHRGHEPLVWVCAPVSEFQSISLLSRVPVCPSSGSCLNSCPSCCWGTGHGTVK